MNIGVDIHEVTRNDQECSRNQGGGITNSPRFLPLFRTYDGGEDGGRLLKEVEDAYGNPRIGVPIASRCVHGVDEEVVVGKRRKYRQKSAFQDCLLAIAGRASTMLSREKRLAVVSNCKAATVNGKRTLKD